MTNYVYIATSLDGYIATKDGGLDRLMNIPNPDGSDHGFSAFMEGVDALIMGRNTFKKVLTFSQRPYTKKVFVLSNTLQNLPVDIREKAEIVSGNIEDILDDLAKRGFQNFYIDGGQTIQSFLKRDLIDEMIITTVPILLGDGISLFGSLENPLQFVTTNTELINNMLVKTYYKRQKESTD